MRIGFVYDMIYPFSKGGAERRYYELGRRLARRHEVHWVGLKLWDGPATMRTDDGVILHGLRRPPSATYVGDGKRSLLEPVWFGAALFRWPGLRHMDVVDCSSFPYFSIFSSRLLTANGRAKLAVTWHEFWGDYWAEYAPQVAWAGRLVERISLSGRHHLIPVSEHTRTKLAGIGIAGGRMSVVPNGVDLKVIDEAPPLFEGPDIVIVGRLIREKRIHMLLQAMAQEPLAGLGAICWVIGRGADGPFLQRQANELGLGDRVFFRSDLADAEVYGAMKRAKVLASLSEREGFGITVLEAMACGTPVVVATGRNSAAPDLVDDGVTGFIVPPDATAVGHTIARIISDPHQAIAMGNAARARAQAFDWDCVAEQAEAVYAAMMDNASPTPARLAQDSRRIAVAGTGYVEHEPARTDDQTGTAGHSARVKE